MQTKAIFFSAALFLMTCIAGPTSLRADDAKDVEQAMTQFYASLNALFTGDVTPMNEVWSHTDDVTYMGPAGGIQTGWGQVQAIWKDQAALKLGGKVDPEQTHVTIGNGLAIVQCYERGDNLDAQGQPVEVSIRATNVFRKQNGQWKMIGHHTDLLPFLEQETKTKGLD